MGRVIEGYVYGEGIEGYVYEEGEGHQIPLSLSQT